MSTGYIIRFTLIMTTLSALLLAGLYTVLKPQHDRNEAIFNKRAILKAVETHLDKKVDKMSDDEVEKLFSGIEQLTINAEGEELAGIMAEEVEMEKEMKKPVADRSLPMFVYDSPKGKVYIASVRGKGLWDAIWANIAIESDFNTLSGIAFDHKGETPGLGAEIKDNPAFPKQFEGKKVYNNKGEIVLNVRKGGARDKTHEVDGISGATVTCVGVNDMIAEGLKLYEPFFDKQKGGASKIED